MIKNPGTLMIFLLLLLFGSEFFISSCASRSAPGGGPRDTLAPRLDTAFPPNFTTFFEGNEILLVFNEYISLKNPGQQVSFSPPLNEKPRVLSQGKEVHITWTDTLLDSTTYTISFGNAITDFTEGNINDNFKYVFSTGSFIDSLELNGQVVDSKTGAGVGEMLVAIYDYATLRSKDSIPFLNLPTYYAFTNEDGRFSFNNLKYGNFHVVAFKDSRGNFKLSTGTEKIAFLSDTLTLTDTTEDVHLLAFDPDPSPRAFAPRHVSKGKIQFPFNYSVSDINIFPLDSSDENLMTPFIRYNNQRDTLTYWLEEGDRDSVRFVVQVTNQKPDTSVVYLRNYTPPKLQLSPLSREIKFNEPIIIRSNLPIDTVFYDSILVLTAKDTIGEGLKRYENENPLMISLIPEKRPREFTLYLKRNAVHAWFNRQNDSLSFQLTELRRDDLGNLDLLVETDSTVPLVLVTYNPEKKEIYREKFRGNLEAQLVHQKPGVYTVDLIIDVNNDGKWSTGSYLERKQPERILSYKDKVEIRANWDLDLIWQPEELNQEDSPESPDSTNESRSDKN